jgi:hypothetical protein
VPVPAPGSAQLRFRPRDGAVSWRDVDGEIIALDVESGVYISLNGSGRVLWMALVESASVDELTALLVSTFGITDDEAMAGATDFLDDLMSRSLIESEG